MSRSEAIVHIVDDDAAVRDSLALSMKSAGRRCEAHESAIAFLQSYDPGQPGCLVADIRMPGMSGLQLQEALNSRGMNIPIIFITGHGDVPMAVDAMQNGALDFIQKPFSNENLLDCVNRALQVDEERRETAREQESIRERMQTLTPREKEVMQKVISGNPNKVIALDLGVSQRTVELHRARVMHKMGVRSLAELVRVAGKVDEPSRD